MSDSPAEGAKPPQDPYDFSLVLDGPLFQLAARTRLSGDALELLGRRVIVMDLYVQGLEAYRQQDWDTAEKRLQQCLRLHPDDGPSRVLLERIAAYREVAPTPGWNGVWRLCEK